MITARARVAGIIGYPVAHSRSPRLHNHWLEHYGLDGAYVPLPVAPADLPTALAGLRAAGLAGANVTIPHKEAMLALCSTLDDAARRSGAVNTLTFGSGGIHGSNTDGAGFLASLAAAGIPTGGPALVLGAGGAARAVAAALLDAGANVTVANRTRDRAHAMQAALPALASIDWAQRSRALAAYDLLVNTTSLGMEGQPPLEIDLSAASRTLVVADVVYVPQRTPLLAQAQRLGLRIIPGLGMLLHQAVPGFAAWFGVSPAVDQATYDLIAADIRLL